MRIYGIFDSMPKGRNETGPNHWLTHLRAATQHVRKRWRGRSQWPVSGTGARLGASEIDMGPPWVKSAALNVDHALAVYPNKRTFSEPRLTSQKGPGSEVAHRNGLPKGRSDSAFWSKEASSPCPVRSCSAIIRQPIEGCQNAWQLQVMTKLARCRQEAMVHHDTDPAQCLDVAGLD